MWWRNDAMQGKDCPCDFWYDTYCNTDIMVSEPLSEIHGIVLLTNSVETQ